MIKAVEELFFFKWSTTLSQSSFSDSPKFLSLYSKDFSLMDNAGFEDKSHLRLAQLIFEGPPC